MEERLDTNCCRSLHRGDSVNELTKRLKSASLRPKPSISVQRIEGLHHIEVCIGTNSFDQKIRGPMSHKHHNVRTFELVELCATQQRNQKTGALQSSGIPHGVLGRIVATCADHARSSWTNFCRSQCPHGLHKTRPRENLSSILPRTSPRAELHGLARVGYRTIKDRKGNS